MDSLFNSKPQLNSFVEYLEIFYSTMKLHNVSSYDKWFFPNVLRVVLFIKHS